uniref:Uncharacterized protein n=1 Tax=Arundo donax TaxID=35708 RepID=A0A0A9F0Q7_ARUDO
MVRDSGGEGPLPATILERTSLAVASLEAFDFLFRFRFLAPLGSGSPPSSGTEQTVLAMMLVTGSAKPKQTPAARRRGASAGMCSSGSAASASS